MKIIYLLIMTGLVSSCIGFSDRNASDNKSNEKGNNVFTDEVLQQIYSFQDSRNTSKLIEYLNNDQIKYKKAAILGLASVQDSLSIMPLAALLSDTNNSTRNLTAFTLGQIRHRNAEIYLLQSYHKEKDKRIKMQILEAIGKCGTEKGIKFLCDLSIPATDTLLIAGQAWGLSRFALQNNINTNSTIKAIELIGSKEISGKTKNIISFYLARAKNIDLGPFTEQIITAYNSSLLVYCKMNLAIALGKCNNSKALEFLLNLIESDIDYRIKVNAIDGLRKFKYNEASAALLKTLSDKNINVQIKASEYFLEKGTEKDTKTYFETAKKVINWRARTNLMAASLKFASNKNSISNSIISGFQVTENPYEKAALLKALAGDVANYKFIEDQTFSTKNKTLSTFGMEALIEIRKNEHFDELNKISLSKKGENLYNEFGIVFKKAIQSEDVAMISMAAGILREPNLKYKEFYKNTYFLFEALKKLKLPQDLEAYTELIHTINYFNGSKIKIPKNTSDYQIDWKQIKSVPQNQKVLIKTSKGKITIQLLVEKAPTSVVNFIRLIKSNFYNGHAFHRVVPNFVIQDGCPRGDGWGGPLYTIRSEFSDLYYEEGSVGMASSGKDTESSQWFITHFPTAHLDGRYTIFGKVIKGMEIVHEIEVGDIIENMELID